MTGGTIIQLTEISSQYPDLSSTFSNEQLVCSRNSQPCRFAALTNLGNAIPNAEGTLVQQVGVVQSGSIVCRNCPTPTI